MIQYYSVKYKTWLPQMSLVHEIRKVKTISQYVTKGHIHSNANNLF